MSRDTNLTGKLRHENAGLRWNEREQAKRISTVHKIDSRLDSVIYVQRCTKGTILSMEEQ